MGLQLEIRKEFHKFRLSIDLTTDQRRVGILGASGAGKSMLLGCISGLVKPDQGRIAVNGKTLYDSEKGVNLSPRERRIGFLFQNYALFPHMTVKQNITFGLDAVHPHHQTEVANTLMNRFHLKDLGHRFPEQLSGGQQQRVALARALAIEPEILLLDEPFSALDDHLRGHMIQEMLEDLKDFTGSVLLVSHSGEEVYRLCDSLAVMDKGRIDSFGPKEEMFRQPKTIESAKITGCKNSAEAIKQGEDTLYIPAWGITAKTISKAWATEGFAGIRANHICLTDNLQGANTYRAWIAGESTGPFRTTLYLKLGSNPTGAEDYHVQWEISREQQAEVIKLPQPFAISFPPEYLIFMGA